MTDGRAESPLETTSRLLMGDLGLPIPTLQLVVRDASGRFLARSDFAWEEERVLGEADGMSKYARFLRPGESPLDVVGREKARENALRAQGWWVIRWGSAELQDPARFRDLVMGALSQSWRQAS